MSSRSTFIGPAETARSRRGSRENSLSNVEIEMPLDDASVTSSVLSIDEAIGKARASPEYKREQEFLPSRRTAGSIDEVDRKQPLHSGKSLEQRLRSRGARELQKKRELGVKDYRGTIINDTNNIKKGGGINMYDDNDDDISELHEKDVEKGVAFTRRDLHKAMRPSRKYIEGVFHKEPPVPEKLFTYENHTVKMKAVKNHAHESYKNIATEKSWKGRLERFTEHELIGHKNDDNELFKEVNGAGGDVYIMIDGLPTNPNRTHRSMKEIRALTATNIVDLKNIEMPPVVKLDPLMKRRAVFDHDF